ncbi:hypothetical protein NEPAR06_1789 [Nematocida parisii]|nr:hypothetical protein NEPAR06_1789 [Nematocida parisii]KAI5156283.1 hypothetical protein NEPAR05_0444 [Nematocida parisii]
MICERKKRKAERRAEGASKKIKGKIYRYSKEAYAIRHGRPKKIEYMKVVRPNNGFGISTKPTVCNAMFFDLYNELGLDQPNTLYRQCYQALENEMMSSVICTPNGYVDCALLQHSFNIPAPVDYYSSYQSYRLLEEKEVSEEAVQNSSEQTAVSLSRSDYVYSSDMWANPLLDTMNDSAPEISIMDNTATPTNWSSSSADSCFIKEDSRCFPLIDFPYKSENVNILPVRDEEKCEHTLMYTEEIRK